MDLRARRTYTFGAFRMDVAEHRLRRDGHPVPLTPKLFDLLRVLVENSGHLVDKERLLKEVWAGAFVEEGNLSRSISVLRKALGETVDDQYIETLPKLGYRFVAAVHADSSDEPDSTLQDPHGERPVMPASIRNAPAGAVALVAIVTIAGLAAVQAVLSRSDRGGALPVAGPSVHRQLTFTGKEITPSLSPDGTRIAYVSRESPHRRVIVQELAAGGRIEVYNAPEAGALRWSPDGTELMFWARSGGLSGQYIAPVSGGPARKIADGFFVACWSPDGSTVALGLFVAGKILFLNRLGEAQRTISLQGTRDWMWDLDWSTVHGRLLVVADDEQRRATIWTIRPDGSEQTKVFTGETEVLAARWAPTGSAIYYFARINQTLSLYKLDLDPTRHTARGEPLLLISGLETDEGFGVSADGNRLVYARAPYYSNLWLVDAAESGEGQPVRQTPLTQGTAVVERPRVSPDGRTILFNMGYERRSNLYTIPAEGGAPRQLTFLTAFTVDGAWSADGRSVAFASTEGGKARVWVVNADGSSPRPVSTGAMSESFDVTWAPGPRILYQQTGNRNFYVIDPERQEEHLLIKDSSVGWAASAEYSPDGKKVAVSWNRPPTRGVWLIDGEDSSETPVYREPHRSGSAPFPIGWSPDGRFIVAIDGKRAAYRGITASFEETLTEARIVRVPLQGGLPETLVSLPFDEVGSVAMFPDGRRFVAVVYSSRSDVWMVEHFDASATIR